MNWSALYSIRRSGDEPRKDMSPGAARNSFLRDYDRVIFSSAFRRLQNKTQVFPLPGAVFVHNRLTHSLEVASVGRSLGKAVGDAIAARYLGESTGFNEFYKYELPSVIAAACLGHDIGNPPFGHSGEDAIRAFFSGLEGSSAGIIHDVLTPNQRRDFEMFEGNANAFRTLTHSFNEDEPGGYKLTYATLAALVKYPSSSLEGFQKTGLIATKKSGFFDSGIPMYAALAAELNIPAKQGFEHVYARHPFVYLTEAADDICYRIIDMEDAHRLNIVSLQEIKDLFLPFFETGGGYNSLGYIEQKMDRINDNNQKAQYLRARWIGWMIEKLAAAFMDKEKELLEGTLEMDLLSCLDPAHRLLIGQINKFSVSRIYNYKSVVEIEIAGYHVIGGLLKEFVGAVIYPALPKSSKLIRLVAGQFPILPGIDHLYHNIQSVVDFISGMTDLYAIDLYRKITGITIPEIR